MAQKTVTIDTNEWKYPGINGVTHIVTNAQTFTFTLTDGGESSVTYVIDGAQSVTTTDGRRIVFLADSDNATNGTGNGNTARTWGPTADTQDNVTVYLLRGRMVTRDPESHVPQYWVADKILVDDVDTPTAITATWRDQYGNTFTWTTVTIS